MNRIWMWGRRLLRWLLGRSRPLTTLRVEELPDRLCESAIYVVGEGVHLWSVAMLCPCGCGSTLQMSVMPEGRPRWRVDMHEDGTASLHPSVWRRTGCRSHFFVRRGHIRWCTDEATLNRRTEG